MADPGCLGLPMPLLLLLLAMMWLAAAQLQNPDYSGKASVKLSTLYDKKDDPVDKSWPPAQDFARVDVTVMGKKVSGAVHNMEPRLDQMKPKKLKKILEGELDPGWVAIERPKQDNATAEPGATGTSLPQYVHDPKLLAQLEKMNLRSMKDDLGKEVIFDEKTVYMFRSWLMKQAACPVGYVWEDLGALFWPRWIRRGMCNSLSSCSWPPGMKCRNSGQKELKILRWVCNEKGAISDEQDPRHGRRSADASGRRQRRGKRRRHDRADGSRKRNAARNRGKLRRKSRNGGNDDSDDDGPPSASAPTAAAAGEAGKLPDGWQPRREGQRERRRRRLIMRMSKTVGDYFCYWRQINYYVTDRCACMCS